jgi:hypothetical protein
LAYRNATSKNVSNFTEIDSTAGGLIGKYNPKKVLHSILNNDKLEHLVACLVFKVRTISSNPEDKIKGKYSKPVDLELVRPGPKLNEGG